MYGYLVQNELQEQQCVGYIQLGLASSKPCTSETTLHVKTEIGILNLALLKVGCCTGKCAPPSQCMFLHLCSIDSKIKNSVQIGSTCTKQVDNNNCYVKQHCSYVLDHFIQHDNCLGVHNYVCARKCQPMATVRELCCGRKMVMQLSAYRYLFSSVEADTTCTFRQSRG